MKVTTTMTREQFDQWMSNLRFQRNRVPVTTKLVRPNQDKPITMQEVMVSWTYDQWKENK